jgi:pimeloyl-ACP methyl ester carboxylesterase
MSKKKIVFGTILLMAAIYGMVYSMRPSYSYKNIKLPVTFERFYADQLEISKEKNTKPLNEELLVRYSNQKTEFAILYLHGFKASRKEGQHVTDKIGSRLKANTYYMRLPGHGTNIEEHRDTKFQEYIDKSTTALLMMNKLGKKVIIVGTSTGGLIGTYLAAQYPKKVAGLILVSPFYDFTSSLAKAMRHYPLLWLYSKVNPKRTLTPKIKESSLYWYNSMYVMSGRPLVHLLKYIAIDEVYEKVTVPTLMFYYYRDDNNQDKTASVKAMLYAFGKFGSASKPSPLNKKVRIINGRHVLMCHLYNTEWDKLENESVEFIRKIK